jgi:hypothetical protein
MNKEDRELTRRMMMSTNLEHMPPRRQMFIPHVDGSFTTDIFRIGLATSLFVAFGGYLFSRYLIGG